MSVYSLLLLFVRLAGCAGTIAIFHYICLPQAFGQTPGAKAFHIDEPIRLDGRLDEPAWKSAVPIGNLIQVLPREGEAPRERTEVRVLVDGNALYFGITCFDSDPSSIIATQLTRDANLGVDDSITIVLDPFFDQRNGFFFTVNSSGARADGQISNNSDSMSREWDGIWDASARITDEGWTAEIVIPFKTLRFAPDQSVWGLNVERVHKRYNETSRWAGARRDIWISNLAEAGRLEGLPRIRQGMGLDIRPYGLITRREGNEWKFDGGLDVSKNLTPNLNASFTLNTDFAETEVDTRQVNLTRFPLLYPEKRTFFLEGAGVFDTATVAGTPFPDLIPFFSRRIGLTEDGITEVPVIVGGKITGRQSGYNIGIMNVMTGDVDEIGLDSQNLFAARVSRDLWKQSYVGGIFTSGNPSGYGGNTLVGADARFATSSFQGNKNLSLSLYMMRTNDELSDTSDYAAGFALEYPNDRWFANIGWKQIGEDFRPALGFVPRTGIRKANAALMFRPRPETGGIRQFVTHVFPEIITDLNNNIESWFINISPLEVRLDSGDDFDFEIRPQFDRISNPAGWQINPRRGIIIPEGDYQFTRYRTKIETATKRRWVINFYTQFGDFYSGTRRDLDIELLLKPSSRL
ncbi:MAG: DUF5916 domain-containing protein, partial [Acidobacteriota bacterium]|nr:DUF5916 domain-containing protein [Acidobacteriota bacterium]